VSITSREHGFQRLLTGNPAFLAFSVFVNWYFIVVPFSCLLPLFISAISNPCLTVANLEKVVISELQENGNPLGFWVKVQYDIKYFNNKP